MENIKETINKLLNSKDYEDINLAVNILKSDEISYEEKENFIKNFLSLPEQSDKITDKEEAEMLKAIQQTWIELCTDNNKNIIDSRISYIKLICKKINASNEPLRLFYSKLIMLHFIILNNINYEF